MVTAVNKTTEETVSPPGTTALAEPSTSQSESIIFPPLISENLTNNTNPVNLHVPDTDSTSTSCQLSESRPDVVAPETVIIIKKRGKMNINSYQLIYVQHERPNDHYGIQNHR